MQWQWVSKHLLTDLLSTGNPNFTSQILGPKFLRYYHYFAEYAKPRVATIIKYGKVELAPPGPGDIAAAIPQAANIVKSAMTFKFAQLTVKVNK